MTQQPRRYVESVKAFYKKSPPIKFSTLKRYVHDPRSWLAGRGFLERRKTTLLTSSTSAGKSTMVAQIAMGLATGLPLWGRIQVNGSPRVMVVQAEDGMDTLQRDVLSVARHVPAGKDIESRLQIHEYHATADEFFEEIQYPLGDYKPDVLIVNPFLSYSAGTDTYAMADTAIWRARMEKLQDIYDFALLLVNHTGKPIKYKGKYPTTDECTGNGMIYKCFGSSGLANWPRLGMELTEIEPASTGRRRFILNFSKAIERTGMTDATGKYVPYLTLEHAMNKDEPYWSLSTELPNVVSLEQFFRFEARRRGGQLPSNVILETAAKSSKFVKVPCGRTVIGEQIQDLHLQGKITYSGEGKNKKRYFVKEEKGGGQSSESARTGAGGLPVSGLPPAFKSRFD